LTEPLFFDTDCLSAFLWINNQSLLAQLYPGRVIIPAQVYAELSIPSVPHLKQRIDVMISSGDARIETIQADTEEYRLCYGEKLVRNFGDWYSEKIAPTAEKYGKAACTLGKAAYNWFTGLFS